jgi:hypothetical protein
LVKPSGSDITVIDASRNPVVVLAGVSEVGLQKFERLISDIKPGEQPLAGVQVTDGFRCSPSAFSLNTQKSMLSPKGLSTPSIPARDLIAGELARAPSEGFMRSWEETFSQRDSQYATSMLRDVERGGPTEVEHILGFMLNKACEANIAHRTLLLAYTHIKAFEQRRAAGGLP